MKEETVVILVVAGIAMIGLFVYMQSQSAAATAATNAANVKANAQLQATLSTNATAVAINNSNNSPLGILSNLADNLDLSSL